MTVQETIEAYSKRDCVEKVFESLKSHLGMDKIGVTTEEAMHGKGFIWFIASILHSLMFMKRKRLGLVTENTILFQQWLINSKQLKLTKI